MSVNFTDKENIRLRRSVKTEDVQNVMSDSAPPKFRTMKAALMYPRVLADKYSQAHLNSSLGGVENYLMLLANMVCVLVLTSSI